LLGHSGAVSRRYSCVGLGDTQFLRMLLAQGNHMTLLTGTEDWR
jgi:hypothetical protein